MLLVAWLPVRRMTGDAGVSPDDRRCGCKSRLPHQLAGVDQLAESFALEAKCWGFESQKLHPHHKCHHPLMVRRLGSQSSNGGFDSPEWNLAAPRTDHIAREL